MKALTLSFFATILLAAMGFWIATLFWFLVWMSGKTFKGKNVVIGLGFFFWIWVVMFIVALGSK